MTYIIQYSDRHLKLIRSLIRTMTCEQLRKIRVTASKIQNSCAPTKQALKYAECIIDAAKKREKKLEQAHLNSSSSPMKYCYYCNKTKPIDDSYFGFGINSNGEPKFKCKACFREYSRAHHSENLELGRKRAADNQKKRQSGQYGNDITYTQEFDLRIRQGDRCAYCDADLKGGGELDHYKPIEKGGFHKLRNRVWACQSCNRNKGRKMPEEFFKERTQNELPIRAGGFFKPTSSTK